MISRAKQAPNPERTEPAPNAPGQRQTHHTGAKRTQPAPNAPKPAPNAPNQRQTHRLDAKRTAPKKDLGTCRGGLISHLGLTTQLQTTYKQVVTRL